MKLRKPKQRNLRFYFKQHKFGMGLYIFGMVVDTLLSVANTLLAAYFLASITSADYDEAIMLLIVFTGCLVTQGFLQLFHNLGYVYLVNKISLQIKKDLVERMFCLSSKTFSDKAMGQFIQRVDNDPHKTLRTLDQILFDVAHVFRYAIIIVYIAVLNIYIALLLAGGLAMIGVIEFFNIKILKKNQKAENNAIDEATSLTSEIVRSEKDIKSLSLVSKLNMVANERYGNQNKLTRHKNYTYMKFMSLRYILTVLLSFGVLLLGLFLVKDVALSIASFLFIYSNREGMNWLMAALGRIFKNTTESKLSAARMFEIFDEEKFPTEKFGNIQMDFIGNIEFKKVGFGYSAEKKKDNTESEKTELLKNLTFKIPANKTVAFVGTSGSGKTTILSLIAKLYDADSGEILFDGTNIKDISKESMRKNISLVNQFPYIFNESIKENLLMTNPDATEKEIIKACKQASFHNFVTGLANGYDTKVGEGGVKLSGGQKQRLAIARAFLRKSKIIMFDESTSSLDNTTQEEIKDSIAKLGGQHTVVIVAHRLSTIKNADIIFFVDEGQIKGQGDFDTLIKSNKNFAKLFELEQIQS